VIDSKIEEGVNLEIRKSLYLTEGGVNIYIEDGVLSLLSARHGKVEK